jgi:hypothetical protein
MIEGVAWIFWEWTLSGHVDMIVEKRVVMRRDVEERLCRWMNAEGELGLEEMLDVGVHDHGCEEE